jgi:Leucine-rich repeat (LRR) protein
MKVFKSKCFPTVLLVTIGCFVTVTCASIESKNDVKKTTKSIELTNKDASILDEQEADVTVDGELLAEVCKASEQPFPDELNCSGLGISSLKRARLTPSGDIPYKKLDLAGNRLTSLLESTFEGHTAQHLRRLDLSSNRLQTIHSSAFVPLSNLIALNLANNQLRALSGDVFAKLPKLLEINLADNQLSLSAALTLPFMPTVRRLDLSGNSHLLTNSVDSALGTNSLPALVQLRLLNCALRNLSDNVFGNEFNKSPSRIQRLDLSGNRFEKIPNRALRQLPRLHVLIMNDTPNMYNLNRDQLTGLNQLRSLHLNRLSRLRSVGPFALADQPRLREFVCTQNSKLIRIEANAFHLQSANASVAKASPTVDTLTDNNKLHPAARSTKWWPAVAAFAPKDQLLKTAQTPPLRVLHLQQNALTMLNARLVNFQHLRSFDLSGNPLRCDCSLNFMFELSQAGVTMRNLEQTKCSRPRRWSEYSVFEAAAVSTGKSPDAADLSGFDSKTGTRLQFSCQKLFDEDNDMFWGMFLLLSVCFVIVVLAFCVMSAYVRTRILDCLHDCCALIGFRQSLLNCYDCCGLLQSKGRYRTFERETRRREQVEPAERIRSDLEWDDREMDL